MTLYIILKLHLPCKHGIAYVSEKLNRPEAGKVGPIPSQFWHVTTDLQSIIQHHVDGLLQIDSLWPHDAIWR